MASFLPIRSAEKRGAENVSPEDNVVEEKANPPAKKTRGPSTDEHFRSWSKYDGSTPPGPVYTLRCCYGDPDMPLSSATKAMRVGDIREVLQDQGLPTDGKKCVLLERLRTQVPTVVLEIDGRECLQRVINAMLFYFKWDNTHLFEATMPRRGSLLQGTLTMAGCVDLSPMLAPFYRESFEKFGDDIYDWPEYHQSAMGYSRSYFIKKVLKDGKWSMADLKQFAYNPRSAGPLRQLTGSAFEAFDPMPPPVAFWSGSQPQHEVDLSLKDLALGAGDKLDVLYDFGDDNRFTVFVEKVDNEERLLPEANLYNLPTRVQLLETGICRIPPQYDSGD